jgi:UDP-glucose 4-epimerase
VNILVTGSSGNIGAYVVRSLCEGHFVRGFDKQTPEQMPEGFEFFQGDIRDRDLLRRAMEGVDAVVHLAAIAFDVPPLHEVFSVNVQGTFNSLDLAVDADVGCFIYASSIMACGFGQNVDPVYLPIDEEHPLLANRPYGLSKRVSEQVCASFSDRTGIRTIRFRLTAATHMENDRGALPYDGRIGEMGIYQYFDMRDFIAMIERVLVQEEIRSETFLVSALDSGHGTPTPQVIREFYPDAELRYSQLVESSPFVTMAKAQRVLGFTPTYSWRNKAAHGASDPA